MGRRFPVSDTLSLAQSSIPLLPEDAVEVPPHISRQIQETIEPSIKTGERGWTAALAPLIALGFFQGARQQDQAHVLPGGPQGLLGLSGVNQAVASTLPDQFLALGARRAGTMAVGLTQTSLDFLTRTINRAMLEGRTSGVGAVGRAINQAFPDMSRARSRLIATTEMNFSMSRASFDRAGALGKRTKQWITVGDDRVDQAVCQPNEGGSRRGIPMANAFDSGHQTTPGHPRCRCSVAFFGGSPRQVQTALEPRNTQLWIALLAPAALIPTVGPEAKMIPAGV